MARERKQEESSGGADWITTYSDLVTLLLCFFVLLFAMAEVDSQKFQAVMQSFQGGMGVMPGGGTIEEQGPTSDGEDPMVTEEIELSGLKVAIDEYSESEGLSDILITQIDERGLTVRMIDTAFFDSGSSDIKQETENLLNFISGILQSPEFNDKHIKVEGHTDSDPVSGAGNYPSNWELSSARATNVLRYLVEAKGIDGSRVSSAGYAYFRPIAPNDTPENKSKNRRVDMVILRTGEQQREPN